MRRWEARNRSFSESSRNTKGDPLGSEIKQEIDDSENGTKIIDFNRKSIDSDLTHKTYRGYNLCQADVPEFQWCIFWYE
ncbi:hypothetical protein MUK42_37157 [Musa troglodytarum]|uniref:Uncharacterized protein n=1 Tax=Musa troglodytarum TaxID=320322 RepID=A0A9E7GSP3_9LILI|nr:hypothetical protein MUK42_37157 [Musa troglodytarum]